MGLRISVTNTSTGSLVFTRIFDSAERSRGLTIGGAHRDDVPLRGQAPGAFEISVRGGTTTIRFNMGDPLSFKRLWPIEGETNLRRVKDGAHFDMGIYRVYFEAEPSTGVPLNESRREARQETRRVRSTPEPAVSGSEEFEVVEI